MTVTKALTVFALVCRLSLAADCNAADEVSLVQTKQALKRVNEHAEDWPSPVHDDYAISDSMPDHLDDGEVTDAFNKNLEKVKDNVEASKAEKLEFADGQHEERIADFKAAEAKIAEDKKAVKKALEEDNEKVEKVAETRQAVIKADAERVADAKEDAEAHAYKQAQTQQAAIAGRVAGYNEALEEDREAQNDMLKKWKDEALEENREDAREYLAKQHALKEAAVNKETQAMKAAEAARVANYGTWKKTAEAEAAAGAAVAETAIEGPEGMKNHILDHSADRAVSEYTRRVMKSQDAVDEASQADFPNGYWPAGP